MRAAQTRFHLTAYARRALCLFMAAILAMGIVPFAPAAPKAYAAAQERPESVIIEAEGKDLHRFDVSKMVTTLDGNDADRTLIFTVNDAYGKLGAADKLREFVLVDSAGKKTIIASSQTNQVSFKQNKIENNKKLMLVTSAKDTNGTMATRYEQELYIRLADVKKAETTPATDGISQDGSSWSFSNGLQYTFKNTGFKFLDNTTMNLSALRLPLTYKHNPDGTTIAGINANPDDNAFYNAVKNGNVWQKYTTDKLAEMTKKMDRGWSGREFGKWGGKAFDWSVCGFMEFNTKNPNAPRALNLIISMGMKADGHAQYLIFTGTITFTIGGKAVLQGKLTPGKGVEGKLGLGAYAGLELYIGLGLNYVASVGGYGKGQINIDFQILPEMYLESVKLSGELGAKAKLFGFTIYTWKILEGTKPLYTRAPQNSSTTKMATRSAVNADGTATSPFTVRADTPYPIDGRGYLNRGSDFAAGQNDALFAQEAQSAGTILTDIYGETELTGATSAKGPVIAYIADAAQVDYSGLARSDENRSVLVYKRQASDGTWSESRVIDTTSGADGTGAFADYTPSITVDGNTCYVTWLAATESIVPNTSIGDVGGTLDVNVATIALGDSIDNDTITVQKVYEESDQSNTMPANPKAVKAGENLYVGWYTNQTTGNSGEVVGANGVHTVRLFSNETGSWTPVKETTTGSGAITSFDVGVFGGQAACAWSFDANIPAVAYGAEITENDGESLNGESAPKTLSTSSVFALTADAGSSIVSQSATNAQFAKSSGNNILTYAQQNQTDDSQGSYLSIESSTAPGVSGTQVLDGKNVNLPTPYYQLTGDLGQNKMGNISFIVMGNGSSDIQTLITKGNGANDWTSVVEATVDDDVVTNYCAMYANGLPLFIYTTEKESALSGDVSTQSDGGADLNQTTENSLRHLSIDDVDFDEFEVKAGENLPITVYFSNDGMLEIPGVDVFILDNGAVSLVGSSADTIPVDGDGSVDFNYALPPASAFTKARDITIYAAPHGTTVTPEMIKRALANESAYAISFGGPSLELEVQHMVKDDQETIVATVTNNGVVPEGGQLVFRDANAGNDLLSFDVEPLGEAESTTYTYDAPAGYFENDGIEDIIIALEDGDDETGYDLKGTEFVNTWDVPAKPKVATSVASNIPKTADWADLMKVLMLLLAIAVISTFVARSARKNGAQGGPPTHSSGPSL